MFDTDDDIFDRLMINMTIRDKQLYIFYCVSFANSYLSWGNDSLINVVNDDNKPIRKKQINF